METKINYIISKVNGDKLESLVVCGFQTLHKDWQFYTVERGYTCKIHMLEFCINCGGTGRIAKTQGKKKLLYSYKECLDCKGEKFPEVEVTDIFLASLENNDG